MTNIVLDQTRDEIKKLEGRIENKEFSQWGGEEYIQSRLKSLKQKEFVLSRNTGEIDAGREELKNVWAKLNKIEAKEKCLRVQILDWFSDKLLDWSNRIHVMSSKIDSPCLIEVAPRKKSDSKHFKESKEIERLKELLANENKKNDELRKQNYEASQVLMVKLDELTKDLK